jgi:hypothetical protein
MAVASSFRSWLRLKIYQLEVTLGVYMYTNGEKFAFCMSPACNPDPIPLHATLASSPCGTRQDKTDKPLLRCPKIHGV